MKKNIPILVLLALVACKQVQKNGSETIDPIDSSTIAETPEKIEGIVADPDVEKQQSIVIKQQQLLDKEDDQDELETLIISKNYIKEADNYSIDFQYPLLNENINPAYANFNDFINLNYVDIVGVEATLVEASELICDTIPIGNKRESRKIAYKVYNVNDQLVSFVFYRENFYSQTLHPTYSFDCMNYDLQESVFMKFEDIFAQGSEEAVREILNETLLEQINSGDLYYDCWGITSDDFFKYKDNFVLDDNVVEYYFDDCVICPSYTGSYSIKILLEDLLPVLRRDAQNRFTL